MLSEMQYFAVSQVVCRDVLACDRRVKHNQAAFLTALQMELKGIEQRRSELIEAIGDYRKRNNLPDPVLIRHQAEMERIEAE